MKQYIYGLIVVLVGSVYLHLLISVATGAAPLAASDLSREPVFYCQEIDPEECRPASARGVIASYANYIEGVVAAEWPAPGNSIHNIHGLEPLQAGSIVVRTFAERFTGGCGAKLRNIVHTEPYPPYNFTVMYYVAQRFSSSKIRDEHRQARQATDGQVLRRAEDNQLACAKHNSNKSWPGNKSRL